MLHWLWKNKRGYAKVRCLDRKIRKYYIYYANCYFGTCVATWKEDDDKKGEFHYNPIFFFNDLHHAKRCLGLEGKHKGDNCLDEIKELHLFAKHLDSEAIAIAKAFAKVGIKVVIENDPKAKRRNR